MRMKRMIISTNNQKVKNWKKLHKRKEREKTNTFLIEGFHLIEEAKKSDWHIIEMIVQEGTNLPTWCQNLEYIEVNHQVFTHISQTQAPQGIAAVVEMKKEVKLKNDDVLLIDAIQDPGNLGTIIRTADAAGFGGIILGDGTVDLYNDKVIRATQGSIFHLPIIQRNIHTAISDLKKEGYTIWATALEGARYYHEVEIDEKVGLVLGNEGAGVDANIIEEADRIVKIPIYGKAESLNVSIAAGILMYHVKSCKKI